LNRSSVGGVQLLPSGSISVDGAPSLAAGARGRRESETRPANREERRGVAHRSSHLRTGAEQLAHPPAGQDDLPRSRRSPRPPPPGSQAPLGNASPGSSASSGLPRSCRTPRFLVPKLPLGYALPEALLPMAGPRATGRRTRSRASRTAAPKPELGHQGYVGASPRTQAPAWVRSPEALLPMAGPRATGKRTRSRASRTGAPKPELGRRRQALLPQACPEAGGRRPRSGASGPEAPKQSLGTRAMWELLLVPKLPLGYALRKLCFP